MIRPSSININYFSHHCKLVGPEASEYRPIGTPQRSSKEQRKPETGMAKFEIPSTATKLVTIPEDQINYQSEPAIVSDLLRFRPVTTEKNIWTYWDKGLEAIFPSYRLTILNWIRKLDPSWTVRVLDRVDGSPNNVYNFVSADWFPGCFINRTINGKNAGQHGADLVRLPLLHEHGGVWMDVGNMLHTSVDELFWDRLTAPDSPYEMGAWVISGRVRREWGSFSNHTIAARKGCVFIKRWHNSYKELWRGGVTNADGFWKHPLIQEIGLAEGMEDWNCAGQVQEISDYLAHMLLGDRTRNLLDEETGWNGQEYFRNKVLKVNGLNNDFLAASRTGYDGEKQAAFLTTPLNETDAEKRQAAEDFVVEMLEDSHMYKVYHSASKIPALGDVIKMKGRGDVDHRVGTFGELYRYGTVRWKSRRAVELAVQPEGEERSIRGTPTMTEKEVRVLRERVCGDDGKVLNGGRGLMLARKQVK